MQEIAKRCPIAIIVIQPRNYAKIKTIVTLQEDPEPDGYYYTEEELNEWLDHIGKELAK